MIKVMERRFGLEVLESKEPVVVEFFTEWSGSAFIIAELLYALEKQYAGEVKFVIVNMDESEQLRRAYGVKKIPTILFFKDGEVVGQLEGTQPRSKIEEVIENILEGQ
jgi:thioredoxin 1